MNLVYTPKFCITIVFDFAWDDYNTQGKRWLCKILGVKQGALWGVFHLNFRQLPVANVTTFSKISKKEGSPARFTQIVGNVFLEVFFPFNFSPGISRIFAWMVRISQIQQFLKPLREISIPFESFGWVDLYSPRGLGEWPAPETRCQVPKLLEGVLTVTDQFPLKKKLGSSPCDKRTAKWPYLTGGNTTVVTTMFYSRYVSWRYGSELTGTSSWSSWTSV